MHGDQTIDETTNGRLERAVGLSRPQPSIDGDDLSRDILRAWTGEECDEVRNVVGLSHGARRDALEDGVARSLAQRARHGRVDEARTHAVHADAAGGEFG